MVVALLWESKHNKYNQQIALSNHDEYLWDVCKDEEIILANFIGKYNNDKKANNDQIGSVFFAGVHTNVL